MTSRNTIGLHGRTYVFPMKRVELGSDNFIMWPLLLTTSIGGSLELRRLCGETF